MTGGSGWRLRLPPTDLQEIKAEKWFCQNCRLKNQIEAAMLDYTDMTGTSRPGVFLTAPYGEQDA